jgi:pyruvate dehydrogenase E2 component (dihydrolipoamide acetyltransferase)
MDVLMPQLGETVKEGKITTWFKVVGDAVKSGDNLFEIETDKVSMEVPSITAGVIAEIRVKAGEVAPVGGVLAVIAESGVVPARSNGAPKAAAVSKPAQMNPFHEVHSPERNFGPAKSTKGVPVTPMARRLASLAGIDLSGVTGSGPHGRIVAADVRGTKPVSIAAPLASSASADQVRALYKDVPFEEVPVDGMRRVIAKRLVEAKQTVPHFYLTSDVTMDRLLALRKEANEEAPTKLSVNDFIIKALALALKGVPHANAVWAEDRILRFSRSDVGVAVAIEGGLLTPVIRSAESKSLSTISAEMRDLAERARQRKLQPAEYQGGSSAISNLGMYGIRVFSGIINPPQATLLAVGAAERRPVEGENGEVRFATQMTVTLSCDHRVVDGALGAQLLNAFKAAMEHPVTMLV